MAGVYRKLKSERLLRAIRGSKTILEGSGSSHELVVRGVVGVPVSLSTFLAVRGYRSAFLQTQNELHSRGFVTNTFYFEERSVTPEVLSAYFVDQNVDIVVSLFPDASTVETSLRLRDHGIGLVSGAIDPTPFACRYRVRRVEAIRSILHTWRSDAKFCKAKLVLTLDSTAADTLQSLVESAQLQCDIVWVSEVRFDSLGKALRRDPGSGVILPGAAASIICRRSPEMFVSLLGECRVALIDGPVDLPQPGAPRVVADLVSVDWKRVAKQIVDDLIAGKAMDAREEIVFKAEPCLRVPLNDSLM